MRVYFAHFMGDYGTATEETVLVALAQHYGNVLNPNDNEHDTAAKEYKQRGENPMLYFCELVNGCTHLVYMACSDGMISSGVAIEIEHARKLGLQVLEVCRDGTLNDLPLDSSRVLTRAATVARLRGKPRRIVVGYSGGVTSAWCLGWALRTYPREEVIALWYDTKEEHPDTYRFKDEMAARLGVAITDYSDGRSVTQLFYDEGMLGNGQQTFCSRILKRERGEACIAELIAGGFDVVRVVGFSAREPDRIHNAVGSADRGKYTVRFPIVEENVTKQQCADWCQCEMGVKPSAMYEDFEHANCLGCVKGGRAYWLKIAEKYPEVFEQRARLEEEFGHTIIRGGNREHPTLRELVQIGLKRKVSQKERIEIGACECGD